MKIYYKRNINLANLQLAKQRNLNVNFLPVGYVTWRSNKKHKNRYYLIVILHDMSVCKLLRFM